MGDNKNSIFNLFGQAKDINQKIGGNTSDSHNSEISSDIDFIIKDISGKIGDLSLSPQDSSQLSDALSKLGQVRATDIPDKKEAKSILQSITGLVAKSANVVISAGINAGVHAIMSRLG